jgi:hypothetical protein
VYHWAKHTTVRLAVARTEHRPAGDRVTDEVWLLDLAGGRLRLERPAARQVAVFDGWAWRVFVEGRGTQDPARQPAVLGAGNLPCWVPADLELRSLAVADGQLARHLALLPFSLLEGGLKVVSAGTCTGPGETRVWDRLLVTYAAETGLAAGDRTVVEINRATHRVDKVLFTWSANPFLGGCWRADLVDWRPAGGVSLSRRWRLVPVNDAGAPTGPARWSVEVRNVTFDVPADGAAFARP